MPAAILAGAAVPAVPTAPDLRPLHLFHGHCRAVGKGVVGSARLLVPTLRVGTGVAGRSASRLMLLCLDAERLGSAFPRGAWERGARQRLYLISTSPTSIYCPPMV